MQVLNARLFAAKSPEIILFAYLCKLLEERRFIPIVKLLVADDWINKHFSLKPVLL